jgi:superfamily II DNA or RNA helicase
MPSLRPYQLTAASETIAAIDAGERPILVLPTGAGKSVVATSIASAVAAAGKRVLFLAHRRELVVQLAGHLQMAGLQVGIIKAGFPRVPTLPVQVASVQTLGRRELPPADLLILDESHHSLARTWKKLVESYPNANILGLTATPWRLDGGGLGAVFSKLIVGAYADDLCKEGYLVEPRVYAPPHPSMKGVHTRTGDYVRSEVSRRVDKPKLVADIVRTWRRHGAGSTTVCFAASVDHSKHIVSEFIAAGIAAEHCDGETPTEMRDAILRRLGSGETQIVSNVDLFGEGFDLPRIACVILARPTQSMALYYQMVGRSMRPKSDGGSAVILDHAGLVWKFGRVTQRLEYSLAGAPKQEKKNASGGTGLRTCPKCFRMVLSSRDVCPECGTVLKGAGRVPEVEDGELMDLAGQPAAMVAGKPVHQDDAAKQEYWEYLTETCAEQARVKGWACWEFKRRFGHFPVTVPIGGRERLVNAASGEEVKAAIYEKFADEGSKKGYKPGYATARCRAIWGDGEIVRKVAV